ncbi:aromatic acid exporter family protein [Bacillus spongiae]|uniref:Aromatic acid exporter family protein n=1 Tax=Bacillus spongiae TaxID=2683610 RepID=A0ABU8H9H8_9BACI
MNLKKYRLFGGRIVKTGIAVFLTALICQWLNLPAVFAVITAIVTIEPTAVDSIRKGLVRFPASAIGAGFALLFTYLLGDVPITYAFAAVATILLTHKLRLDDGMLVATLTAIAMIPTTQDHYVASYVTRLGTTSIGLIVSSLVNFLVMPPHYSNKISTNLNSLFVQTGDLFQKRMQSVLLENTRNPTTERLFQRIRKEIDRTEILCHYQREEWKFHRHSKAELKFFQSKQQKLLILRQILYHVGNLVYLEEKNILWSEKQHSLIQKASSSLAETLMNPSVSFTSEHYSLMRKIAEEFWHLNSPQYQQKPSEYTSLFSPEAVILYELLSIQELIEELEQTKSPTEITIPAHQAIHK